MSYFAEPEQQLRNHRYCEVVGDQYLILLILHLMLFPNSLRQTAAPPAAVGGEVAAEAVEAAEGVAAEGVAAVAAVAAKEAAAAVAEVVEVVEVVEAEPCIGGPEELGVDPSQIAAEAEVHPNHLL